MDPGLQISISSSGAFLTNAGNAGCIPTVFAYVIPAYNNVCLTLMFLRPPIMLSFTVKGVFVVNLFSISNILCYIDLFRLLCKFLWEALGQL